MDAYPREAWERLGRHLKQRRPQINPRYRIRKVFAEEHQLTDKTVQEIENAYRTTFSDVMLSTIERAYQLQPGSITRVLKGGELELLEPAVRASPLPEARGRSDPTAAEASPDDRRVTVDLPNGPDLTLEEAIRTVEEADGPLTKDERILVNTLELMEYEPDVIAGIVILSRRAARRAGQDVGRARKRA